MRLAFWNIGEHHEAAAWLAQHTRLDAIVLAECRRPDRVEDMLRATDAMWTGVAGTGRRLTVFARSQRTVSRHAGERFCIVGLGAAGGRELNLCAVHLPSRLRASASDVSLDCFAVRRRVLDVEARAGHRRTLIIGDFNLDPYDIGLNDRRLLIGVMDRRLAARMALSRRREVRDGIFYNPMWSRLGDDSVGPPGTYYARHDDHHDYRFHTFDQVLVRPCLIPALQAVDVPRAVGGITLVSANDLPRARTLPDHLPVLVELDLGGDDV